MAFKKALRKLGMEDELANRFQDNVSQALQPFLSFPIADGVLLKGVNLSGTAFQEVQHRLGRPARGWLVVRKSANADVWEDFTKTNLLDRFLHLRSNTAVIVDLWVF